MDRIDMKTMVTREIVKFEEKLLFKKSNSFYNRIVKRLLGLFIALILYIILLPLFLIISLAIFIDSGLPIFYKADRGGYKGNTFKIYKFRTMIKNADKIGGGTTALYDSRITKVGRVLRKTKLDEIPQLINIIKGEMSFVGPRPELIKYTSQYIGLEEYILKVRPGITDFSSIQLINLDEIVGDKDVDEMYELHILKSKNTLRIKYANEISFLVDLKLFFETVVKTIKKAVNVIFKAGEKNGANLT